MKKLFCIALCILFIFSFSACGKQESTDGIDNSVSDSKFGFLATDISGNIVRFSDFADAKVLMLNFWEPWCQPCLSEMPDLESLYEKYEDNGLVILGVFTSQGMDDDIRAVLDEYGITYPILRGEDERLLALQTEYVPTTVFLRTDGTILTPEPIVGVRSFVEYEKMVKEYLQ